MHPEIFSIALFWFVTAYTPGPNNVVASYSGFNFGITKTLPHIFGVTLGFTSLSVVRSELMRNKGSWIPIEEADYQPIAQGVVIINQDAMQDRLSEEFYNYLFSEEAGEILEDFGYSRNE